ncbi:MAG: DUF126 domain-containing protein [Desulfurococcales archaeon]|nr:DUF126 domain-containing protein [Desulfurococcales archaeon]
MRLKVREILPPKEKVCGEVMVIDHGISFLGDVDVEKGLIEGKYRVSGKLLMFPHAVGSTVGSYVIYGLRAKGNAPKAIITGKEDPVTIIGCIISGIPLYVLKGSDVKELTYLSGVEACIEGGEVRFEG